MQKVKLPKTIDPIKSANKCSEYSGVFNASDMPRWQAAVVSCGDVIHVEAKFEKDAQSLTLFHGTLDTTATLICQRCNSLLEQTVHVDYCFTPVQGPDIDELELPEAYEPVEVDEHGIVSLLQLFEDELIIALPIVALHAEDACTVTKEDMTFGILEPEQERQNPFAVLQELKRDQE
ncbi:MAG: 23S rRNA accumulation protein YceD [Glaciecola sp.]|nr:23S rRNA accumulation protein YceD [Glaciecola sp.]